MKKVALSLAMLAPLILAMACVVVGFMIGKGDKEKGHQTMFNRGFETGSMATFLSIQKDVARGKFPETMEQALVNAREQYSKMGGSLSTNK